VRIQSQGLSYDDDIKLDVEKLIQLAWETLEIEEKKPFMEHLASGLDTSEYLTALKQ